MLAVKCGGQVLVQLLRLQVGELRHDHQEGLLLELRILRFQRRVVQPSRERN